MVYVFLANGFEEIEAMAVVDLIRRAGKTVELVSVTGDKYVTGSRQVTMETDCLLEDILDNECEMAVLPGGMPGVTNLKSSASLESYIKKCHSQGKWIAAICAAPSVLEKWGLLGAKATISESFINEMAPERFSRERVVVCDHIITSRAPGTAIEFALEIITQLYGAELSNTIKKDILAEKE